MGEVYRARDSKLGREVALKVLPAAVTQDPDRVARFAREAQLLAALNHSNIAAIYGIEEASAHDGTSARALILELVDGETLAERIARGSLPLGEALGVASQIASALDAAHRKGIVHRDLKPANIKVTTEGVVKVLDFGLAKAIDRQSKLSESPTITTLGTRVGVVMGTPGYMSPEQARGHPVDARTDIWAFGCVLYEMLTGRRTFDGQTMSDTIARILEREPDWAALPRATPPPVRDLLKRCLNKDPSGRPADLTSVRAMLDRARAAGAWPALVRAMVAVGAVGLAGALALAGLSWLRSDRLTPTGSSSWEQITSFPDSAAQPALSPDGRMLAFVRGEGTFATVGQVYLKRLPDGEPTPLTSDGLRKMDPVFSPDGNRLAYTAIGDPSLHGGWDTWVVPVLRGNPRSWLKNASGLTWVGPSQLLFSEIRTGQHMGLVTSADSRADPRELYFPAHRDGMAHRSSRSPDGRWTLVVEMDERGVFTPCRIIPWEGGSSGRLVGPAPSRCMNAAWAPDGEWMYFTANTGAGFHVWRQRFPQGEPEQITTAGTTEEEGLAVAADGGSLITSVGQQKRGVWIHDASGERQVSLEGYAFWPLFSADGRTLCFRVTRSTASGQSPSELWMSDLESGRIDRLLPGQLITQYDLSRDNRLVVSVKEADGTPRLWLAWLDGREPPRRLGHLEGISPRFGAGGAIYFLGTDGGSNAVLRTDDTGKTPERITPEKAGYVLGLVSPDGSWLSTLHDSDVVALPTGGGAAVPVLREAVARLRWSPDGSRALLQVQSAEASAFGSGRTYVLPLDAGSVLPRVPRGGFQNETEIAAVPGVEILPYADLAFSPAPGVYAFSKIVTTRNLYRVPLR